MRVTWVQGAGLKVVTVGVLAALLAAGCSADEHVAVKDSALSAQNGLTTNALTRNALTRNALTRNALTRNALTRNALTRNALTRNALTLTADTLDGLVQGGASAADLEAERSLRADGRKLVEYLYSCAMPAGTDLALEFSTEGTDGSTCDGGTLSADGLTCSYGTLSGQLGLAPTWGTEECGESCQRWVSACVLARTNYWGVRVEISMRGAHPALTTDEAERAEFPLREGTYFGNIFTETTDGSSAPVYTPSYHACGGPGSNEPMVTQRFCSSSAGDCLIDVAPSCACTEVDASAYPQGYFTAFADDPSSFLGIGLSFSCATTERSCGGVTSDGAMTDCFNEAGTAYPEALTVFLKNAAVCGNSVCEPGEDAQSCASDCRADVWANRYSTIAETFATDLAALSDESLVMIGVSNTWQPVDLGHGNLFPIATTNTAKPFLGRISSNGSLIWGRAVAPTTINTFNVTEAPVNHVATSAADQIVLGGDAYNGVSGPGYNAAKEAWVMALTQTGSIAWQRSYVTGDRMSVVALSGLDVDAAGGIIIAGSFTGNATFGGDTLVGTGREDIYLVKLRSDGTHVWSRGLGSFFANGVAAQDRVSDIDVDDDGNTVMAACYKGSSCDWVGRFGADGTLLWGKNLGVQAERVTSDASGNMYVIGRLSGTHDFGAGSIGSASPSLYLAKYAADGTFVAAQIVATGDATGGMWSDSLELDADGNAIVGGSFTRTLSAGTTDLDAGAYTDLFVVKVTPGGVSWLKQMGGPLQDYFGGMVVENGRVAVAGDLQASILFEQKLLSASVAAPPASSSYWGDVFLGSFADPTSSIPNDGCAFVAAGTPCVDREPPVITLPAMPLTDPSTGFPAASVEATSWWFTINHLLSAVDGVDGAVAVDCRRLDYAMQPLTEVSPTAANVAGWTGWSYFACTATDAAGNTSRRRFTVRSSDTTAPTITTPGSLIVDATSNVGANVQFQVTATDAVEVMQTICSHYAGAFPLGTTTVSCTSSDRRGNSATASFDITVRYASSGITAPTAGQTFTKGSTIKVAFSLTGGSAAISNASAQLYVAPVVNGVVGAETLSGNFAFSKRGGYSASLATRKLAAGTYRLRVDLRDGVVRTVQIKLI